MRRRRARLVVACVVTVALAVVLITGRTGHERAPAPRPPANAEAFLDSVGVAMHLAYTDTSYADQPQVMSLLRRLGVRHVREGVPVGSPALDRGLRSIAGIGLGGTLVTALNVPPVTAIPAATAAMGPKLDALEGPNELDRMGPPDWRRRLVPYMRGLRDSITRSRRPVTLLGPSFVDSSFYSLISTRTYDVASLHIYPGGEPPERALADQIDQGQVAAPNRPVDVTETGYHNALAATTGQPAVSEAAAAVYLPRALLSAFRDGARRTFIYELLDEKPDPGLLDPEKHFGLVRQDLSPKPAFFAVRNLLTAVRQSPGPAATPPPTPSISTRGPVDRLALSRADGSVVVALWRAASVWDVDRRRPLDPATAAVTLTWRRPVVDLTVTRPSLSERAAMRSPSTRRVSLSLAGDVVLLSYR